MKISFKSLLLLAAAHTTLSIASAASLSYQNTAINNESEKKTIFRSASTMLIVLRDGTPYVYLGRRNYSYNHIRGRKESFRYTDFGGKVDDKDLKFGEQYPGLSAAIRELSEETKKQYNARAEYLFPIAEIDITNNLLNEQSQLNTKHSLFAFITDQFNDLNQIQGTTREENEFDRYDLIKLDDLLSLHEPFEISRFTENEGELLPSFYSLLKHHKVRRRLELAVKTRTNQSSTQFPLYTFSDMANVKMTFQTKEPFGWIDRSERSKDHYAHPSIYVRLYGSKRHNDPNISFTLELAKDHKQKGKKKPGKAYRKRNTQFNNLVSLINHKIRINGEIKNHIQPDISFIQSLNLPFTASEAMLKHLLKKDYVDGDRSANIKKAVTIINYELGKESSKIADAEKVLERVMQTEEDHPNHYAVYHGTDSVSAFLYVLYNTTHALVTGDNTRIFMPRPFDNDYFEVQTINSLFERDISTNEHLLSANISIFSNWQSDTSNSLLYLMQNNCSQTQNLKSRIHEILTNFNITSDDSLLERFNEIFKRHFTTDNHKERGSLFQILLPKDLASVSMRFTDTGYGQNLIAKDYHLLKTIADRANPERSEFTMAILDIIRSGNMPQLVEKMPSLASGGKIRLVTDGRVFDQKSGAILRHYFYPEIENDQREELVHDLMKITNTIFNPVTQTNLHNQYDLYHRSARMVEFVLNDKTHVRLAPTQQQEMNLYGFLKSASFDDIIEYFEVYPDQLAAKPNTINASKIIKDESGRKLDFNTFLDLAIHMGYEYNRYSHGQNNKIGKFIVYHTTRHF